MKSLHPVLFVGHGSPMNAVETNSFTETLRTLRKSLPTPKAILCISAHWEADGFFVQAGRRPKTIHDFSGFSRELYEVHYNAPGAVEVARRAAELLRPLGAATTETWGFDHGVWSVLVHLFPERDVPVTSVSLNTGADAKSHFEIGQRLAPLRDEGVLILGSGNIVHNLAKLNWGNVNAEPFSWALSFDTAVKEALVNKDHERLIDFRSLEGASLSHPTVEHYMGVFRCDW